MMHHIREATSRIRTNLKYFCPNATELVQPCDSFVIEKIKCAWKKRWDEYKLNQINQNAWTTGGKLPNPGKSFFLRLASDSVRDVNLQRDENGLTYARKAMILCGLSLNTNGKWEETQLKPELQNIISRHRSVFESPDADDVQSGSQDDEQEVNK